MTAKKKATRKKCYKMPITALREVVVGWRLACERCDELFEAKREDARFCSSTCRSAASRAAKS